MMNERIDPGFQAAPYLGDSTHDPVEFARRVKKEKFALEQAKKEKKEQEIAQGLKNLMVEVKAWDDQKGFEEIQNEKQKILDAFIELSRKGMNLTTPSTTDELLVFRELNEAFEKLKYKVAVYEENKKAYDFYVQQINDPKNEELIDKEASYKKLQDLLATDGVLNKKEKLMNLLVKKPQVADIAKIIAENKDLITKPPVITNTVVDEDGIERTVTVEQVTPDIEKQIIADLKKIYNSLPPEKKKGIAEVLKNDDTVPEEWTPEDYFIYVGFPKYKQRFSNKPASTSGGINFNFGSTQAKVTPGRLRKEPLVFGNMEFDSLYEFYVNKPVTFPVKGENSLRYSYGEWNKLKKDGTLTGQLLYYDARRDGFLFKLTEGSKTPFAENNDNIFVPRSVFGESLDELPIEGKKKLKDIAPLAEPTGKKFIWHYVISGMEPIKK